MSPSREAPDVHAGPPTYDTVKQLLNEAVGPQSFGGHGDFWNRLHRLEFVALKMYGQPLLVMRDARNSNLIKALRGLPPFGRDQGVAGAMYRRMPAGRAPMPEQGIRTIEAWINAGCPDGSGPQSRLMGLKGMPRSGKLSAAYTTDTVGLVTVARSGGRAVTKDAEFAFWTALDEFERPYFPLHPDAGRFIGDWRNAQQASSSGPVALVNPRESVQRLGLAQKKLLVQFFGNPLSLPALLRAFESFASRRMPADSQGRQHDMDATIMWYVWGGFAEACIESRQDVDLWNAILRGLILGALIDGRDGFSFAGGLPAPLFDSVGATGASSFASGLKDDELIPTLHQLFRESGVEP